MPGPAENAPPAGGSAPPSPPARPEPAAGTSRARQFFQELARSRAARNFAWLVADRGLRLVLMLFVGTWVARYLGEAQFGLLNYGLALTAIFAAIAPLGMESLAVREIIRDPASAGAWIGTVVTVRSAVSVLFAFLSVLLASVLRPSEPSTLLLVALLSVGSIGFAFESGELWFQARTEMARLIVPRLGLSFLMAGVKIYLILAQQAVVAFAAVTAVEQILSGLFTVGLCRTALPAGSKFRVQLSLAAKLLRDSWPLAVSSACVILYLKLGQLLVGHYLGDEQLGVFAAGIRLPEIALFLPAVLGSSMLPGLMRSREIGPEAYRGALLRYFRISALLSYLVCLPFLFGSDLIARLLYQSSYQGAGQVMETYSWFIIFVFLGFARGQHLLNEKKVRLSLAFSFVGLLVLLALSVILIPRFGLMGAVLANLGSYISAGLAASFVFPATRELGKMQVLALASPWLAFRRLPAAASL